MKHNSVTQSDTGLAFDGAGHETNPKARGGLHVNRFTGYMNDGRLVNKGRGPTVGNHGCEDGSRPGASASVTRDAYQCPPVSGVPKIPAQGSIRDNINRGSQYRGSGGVMAKSPSNPDKIRIDQSGHGTYNSARPSRVPNTARGQNNFNFGPKSQY